MDRKRAIEILANQGIEDLTGYVVHHDFREGIMQLIESNIHSEFTHYGGRYYFK